MLWVICGLLRMDISSVKLRFPVALKTCLGPWLEIDSKILTSISLSRSSLIDSPKCHILSSHALHWYDSISWFFHLAIFIIIVVVVYSKMLIRHASIFLKKISCFPYSKAVLMYLVLNCRHTFVKDVILCALIEELNSLNAFTQFHTDIIPLGYRISCI